jgi:hypothetical protein
MMQADEIRKMLPPMLPWPFSLDFLLNARVDQVIDFKGVGPAGLEPATKRL